MCKACTPGSWAGCPSKAAASSKKPGHTQGVPGFGGGRKPESSGRRVGGWHTGRRIAVGGRRIVPIVGRIILLALRLALELFFFFAFFRELFLALFVRVIGSCHCVLS